MTLLRRTLAAVTVAAALLAVPVSAAAHPGSQATEAGAGANAAGDDAPAQAAAVEDPPDVDPGPTPRADCGPGSNPEGGRQGRVSADDVASGRAAQGYTCNAELVGHHGISGGYKVERYVDAAGHECAYYDTELLFPTGAVDSADQLTGVYVLDMTDPANPVKTDNLLTPAMQSPHESMDLNAERGLLAAGLGNPVVGPGVVDVYDVSEDCRHPVLQSSTPLGIFGHEGAFAPDGLTYYVASLSTSTIVALDVSNPVTPTIVWVGNTSSHGLAISDDGNRAYLAAREGVGPDDLPGLVVLDTSQVQARVPNPETPVVGAVTWEAVSIPQFAAPITIDGHPYALEVDEFAGRPVPGTGPNDPVGAARIIDLADETAPRLVSNLRLEVHQPENRTDQLVDPGANSSLQGYAAHYCNVPSRVDPAIVACSFILSGLRIFDIRDPLHPREVAYFNPPDLPDDDDTTSYAMSRPTFVKERGEVWYSDGNSGFYVVRLTNGVWPGAGTAAQAPTTTTTEPATTVPPGGPGSGGSGAGSSLPATGALPPVAVGAAVLGAGLWLSARSRRGRGRL